MLLVLVLIDLVWVSVALIVVAGGVIVVTSLRAAALQALPWRAMTRVLNTFALLLALVGVVISGLTGSLSIVGVDRTPAGSGNVTVPDLFLIMLDAYPRADTLARDFAYDNEPFLREMEHLGFDVADGAQSNYNGTPLTLASLFNMAQIHDIPGLSRPGADWRQDYRMLANAINQGSGIGELRRAGYEIVAIPSGFSKVDLVTADRLLDTGQLTEFELELLYTPGLRRLLPDWQREVLMTDHRNRIVATFDLLKRLGREPSARPKFVFAHLLTPHAPIVFQGDGSPAFGWDCFPEACSIYYGGQRYGLAGIRDATRSQVVHVNRLVEETVEAIVGGSPDFGCGGLLGSRIPSQLRRSR